MVSLPNFSGLERHVMLLAGCIIVLAGIQMASWILGPLLLSAFCAVVLSIVAKWLKGKGFSRHMAFMLTILILVLAVLGVIGLIVTSVVPLMSDLFGPGGNLSSEMNNLQKVVDNLGIAPGNNLSIQEIIGPLISTAASLMSNLINGVSALFIVVFTTFFLLLEADGFSRKMQYAFRDRISVFDRAVEFNQVLIDYIIIRTKVNLFTAVSFGIVLVVFGIKGAAGWALLMFILSYIPYIGMFAALVPPALLAYGDAGVMGLLLLILAASIINLIAENLIFPQLAGQGLDLSPVVVFVSILFWGFILGGAGVFLSVPLTVLLKMIFESSDDTRWIAHLMGQKIPQTKDTSERS